MTGLPRNKSSATRSRELYIKEIKEGRLPRLNHIELVNAMFVAVKYNQPEVFDHLLQQRSESDLMQLTIV
jgi:hypothetical protein